MKKYGVTYAPSETGVHSCVSLSKPLQDKEVAMVIHTVDVTNDGPKVTYLIHSVGCSVITKQRKGK